MPLNARETRSTLAELPDGEMTPYEKDFRSAAAIVWRLIGQVGSQADEAWELGRVSEAVCHEKALHLLGRAHRHLIQRANAAT